MKERRTVDILGVAVDRTTLEEAAATVADFVERARRAGVAEPRLVVTPNAEMIYRASHDPQVKAILNGADLAVPDGAGVVLASRILGRGLLERVTGIDLMERILATAAERGYRVYLLGSRPEVIRAAAENIVARHRGLTLAGFHHGYFADGTAAEEEIVAAIAASRAEILFAGMGSPKQEIWLAHRLAATGAAVGVGVGGSLDVYAGTARRAPAWMRQAGLEWLYRLVREPRRAGRMLALPLFLGSAVLSAVARGGTKRKGGVD